MKSTPTFAITISRQLGCGGAFIGQQLAASLAINYFDRQIISSVAEKYALTVADLEAKDEKAESFWGSAWQDYSFEYPGVYAPLMIPSAYQPTDRNLFTEEAEVIRRAAAEGSAVIIGRCGCRVLKDHPNHISIFLYANEGFRSIQLQKRFDLTKEEADRMIKENDHDRRKYFHKMTGYEWTDPSNYDLMLDTSKLGLEASAAFIMEYIDRLNVGQ